MECIDLEKKCAFYIAGGDKDRWAECGKRKLAVCISFPATLPAKAAHTSGENSVV